MTKLAVYGAPEGYDALLIARRRAEHKGALLHVARDDARLAELAQALAFFAPHLEVLRFPAWDCVPYDRISPHAAIAAERAATLTRLLEPDEEGRRVVLTTVNALIQRLPPRAAFAGRSRRLAPDLEVAPDELARFLDQAGYGRTNTVFEPGEYAIRGGIVDIFPAGENEPVRLDLFGDRIETLRRFDPSTQRSGEPVAEVVLRPVSELPGGPEAVARFRAGWREAFGMEATSDPLYAAVSEGRRHPSAEHWLPLFYDGMETLLDYLPDASVSLDHQVEGVLEVRLETIADHYAARRAPPRPGEPPYRPLPPKRLYLDREGWEAMLAPFPVLAFSPFAPPEGGDGVDAGGRPAPLLNELARGEGRDPFTALAARLPALAGGGRPVLLVAYSRGSQARLVHLLTEHGLAAQPVADWAGVGGLAPGAVGVAVLGLERGFIAPELAALSEQDLLGARLSRPPPRRRRRADQLLAAALELSEGDLVVHRDHGIGRYDGLVTLDVDGAPHDCLRLIYEGGDKLFLPVENIDLISRFGSDESGVALDRLGGAGWQQRKARARSRIREMAAELIRIAAERQLKAGEVLTPPEGGYEAFCARFPHVETEDQARAIEEVLADLASGRPMDRLICGDVGFGKTEVALRAAFIAAMAGTQVAVVVPTTLLARQHFRTFSERFAGFPVRIAQLSRLVSAREAEAVRRELAAGGIDIVIGTHALLSESVRFANLGLLIIDEEQHFGVAHKEKLKRLKADVHVLTLTATPIPRTLQLALSGVREMSVIATPPVDRLAVRTFIMPFDDLIIREAIARERFRGGQVFCIAPRIEDLAPLMARLREIVPEARLVEAHGRLAPSRLEAVMTAFGEGRYDVLVATNIVESGLDMPGVNTLIVHRADRFGLAQLYQLRGRIGRGKQRGYAYLTWPPGRPLSAAAERRLAVMQTLDTLGAGFTLASHDLDIRGAGNLLGEEQSGHIREVGIELYQQMLEEAVEELRAGGTERAEAREEGVSINLGLPVLIPETYVADLPVRLSLYRRIGALASDAESEAMAAELVDRFGPLPPEVVNLLDVVALKRACREAGVEKLEAGPKGMVLTLQPRRFADPAGLIAWLGARRWQKEGLAEDIRLRPDHKLVVSLELPPGGRVKAARRLLAALARLARKAKAA